MNEEQIKKLKEIIQEEEKQYDFNDYIGNWIKDEDLKEIENEDDLKTYLEELNQDYEITDIEMIYYTNAIKYLAENDASLNESLKIAKEYGFETDELNSEVLASLLCSRNNQEDYSSFIGDVVSQMEEVLNNEE